MAYHFSANKPPSRQSAQKKTNPTGSNNTYNALIDGSQTTGTICNIRCMTPRYKNRGKIANALS
jgi:hypothetical protein